MDARKREQLKGLGLMTLGTVIMVVGIYFFKYPNHFSTGGVSGMSVILAHYVPAVSPASFSLIINMLLLLLGYLTIGHGFGYKTAYITVLQSVLLWGLERVLPMDAPMTSQPMLELVFAVTLPAIGSALLFNIGASSGGTDIVAMILRKHSSLDIGKALLASDCIITLAACVAFGMEIGLYSILGLAMKSLLVDMVLENIHTHKCFHIITADPEPIEQFITHQLNRGATRLMGEGIYTGEDREVILTVVSRKQAVELRRFIRQHEPNAFLLITNTGEIIGKGFRGLD